MEEFDNYQAVIRQLAANTAERYDLQWALQEAEQALADKILEKHAYFPHCDLDIQNNVYVRSAKCLLETEDGCHIHEIEDARIVNGHFEPIDEDDLLEHVKDDEYRLNDSLTDEEIGTVKMLGVFDFKVIENGGVEWYYTLEDLCDD